MGAFLIRVWFSILWLSFLRSKLIIFDGWGKGFFKIKVGLFSISRTHFDFRRRLFKRLGPTPQKIKEILFTFSINIFTFSINPLYTSAPNFTFCWFTFLISREHFKSSKPLLYIKNQPLQKTNPFTPTPLHPHPLQLYNPL